jgi:hypothetical protein
MTLKARQQNFEKPMFHITIDLEHISLNLTRTQVRSQSNSFVFFEFNDHYLVFGYTRSIGISRLYDSKIEIY